jgi:hypothetical protein
LTMVKVEATANPALSCKNPRRESLFADLGMNHSFLRGGGRKKIQHTCIVHSFCLPCLSLA